MNIKRIFISQIKFFVKTLKNKINAVFMTCPLYRKPIDPTNGVR